MKTNKERRLFINSSCDIAFKLNDSTGNQLMIESGRYDQILRENRLCPSCSSSEIEEEIHFLFNCPKYSIPRDEFYNEVQFHVHNIKQLPPIEANKELMSSSNYFVNLQLMKLVLTCLIFVANCYQFRMILSLTFFLN